MCSQIYYAQDPSGSGSACVLLEDAPLKNQKVFKTAQTIIYGIIARKPDAPSRRAMFAMLHKIRHVATLNACAALRRHPHPMAIANCRQVATLYAAWYANEPYTGAHCLFSGSGAVACIDAKMQLTPCTTCTGCVGRLRHSLHLSVLHHNLHIAWTLQQHHIALQARHCLLLCVVGILSSALLAIYQKQAHVRHKPLA